MKILACLAAALALPFACHASDISDLASGYASAFKCLERSTANIAYSNGGQTETLKDVKEIKPFGGALLIRFNNGDQMILNAAGISRITQ